VLGSRRYTIREVAHDNGISFVPSNFNGLLGMRRVTNIADVCQQSLFINCSVLTKRIVEWASRAMQCYRFTQKNHNRWRNMSSIVPVEELWITKTKKKHGKFHQMWTWCIMSSCHRTGKNGQQRILPVKLCNPPEAPGFVEEQKLALHHDNAPLTSLLVRKCDLWSFHIPETKEAHEKGYFRGVIYDWSSKWKWRNDIFYWRIWNYKG